MKRALMIAVLMAANTAGAQTLGEELSNAGAYIYNVDRPCHALIEPGGKGAKYNAEGRDAIYRTCLVGAEFALTDKEARYQSAYEGFKAIAAKEGAKAAHFDTALKLGYDQGKALLLAIQGRE